SHEVVEFLAKRAPGYAIGHGNARLYLQGRNRSWIVPFRADGREPQDRSPLDIRESVPLSGPRFPPREKSPPNLEQYTTSSPASYRNTKYAEDGGSSLDINRISAGCYLRKAHDPRTEPLLMLLPRQLPQIDKEISR